jgi:hypothetical protein
MSASKHVANGPESTCSKARILTPSNARDGFELLATLTSSHDQQIEQIYFLTSFISGNKSFFGANAFFQTITLRA